MASAVQAVYPLIQDVDVLQYHVRRWASQRESPAVALQGVAFLRQSCGQLDYPHRTGGCKEYYVVAVAFDVAAVGVPSSVVKVFLGLQFKRT